jgi:hypothetical protein
MKNASNTKGKMKNASSKKGKIKIAWHAPPRAATCIVASNKKGKMKNASNTKGKMKNASSKKGKIKIAWHAPRAATRQPRRPSKRSTSPRGTSAARRS